MDRYLSHNYIKLILIHIGLAAVIFVAPFLSKLYSFVILGVGFYYILKNQNRNNEALFVAAYLVGSEVFMRMTGGNPFHELTKYSIIVFMILGAIFSGVSRGSLVFVFFILLLIPAVYVATETLNFDTNIRKAIMFNLSGPLCLGFSAIYTYRRKVTLAELNDVLLVMVLPILSALTYVFLYNPSIKDVVTNTQSNFATSGGFGPNQVSTILGLGSFIMFSRIVLSSKKKLYLLVNIVICILLTYRGIVTFSRGGMMTAAVMVVIFLGILFIYTNTKSKGNIVMIVFGGLFFLSIVWMYSVIQTGGMIENRYANKGVRGNKKESQLSGRETLMETEMQMFLDSPIFGIGVGKNKEYREELTGIESASHNEITRMLAEHGSLGIIAFIILLVTPFVLYLDNKMHIYVLSFFVFWILTINHAAMRTAAPAFIYALTLLKVYALEKPTVHRE